MHGIVQDVVGLFAPGFFASQAVVEKTPLPLDLGSHGCPSFPIADDSPQGTIKRQPHEQMNMVGHDDHHFDKPQTAFHPVSGSLEENLRHSGQGERTELAMQRAESEEDDLSTDTDPCWRIMRQFLSAWFVHGTQPNTESE